MYIDDKKIVDDYVRMLQTGVVDTHEIAEAMNIEHTKLIGIIDSPRYNQYIKTKMVEMGLTLDGLMNTIDEYLDSERSPGVPAYSDSEIASFFNIPVRVVTYRRRFKKKNLI